MSCASNPNPVVNDDVGPSTTAPTYGNGGPGPDFGQLSSGASAAFLDALHAEIAMQAQMMGYLGYQEALMVKVNTSAALAQANATINSATNQSNSTRQEALGLQAAAGGSFGAAAVSGAALGGGVLYAKYSSTGTEKTTLDAYRDKAWESTSEADVTVSTRSTAAKEKFDALPAEKKATLEKRWSEMQSGNFFKAGKFSKDSDLEAIEHIYDDGVRNKILDNLSSAMRERDSAITSMNDKIGQFANMGTTLAQAGGQYAQGNRQIESAVQQAQKGTYDAQTQIAANLQNQAAQNVNNLDGKIKSELDEITQEIAAYVNIAPKV